MALFVVDWYTSIRALEWACLRSARLFQGVATIIPGSVTSELAMRFPRDSMWAITTSGGDLGCAWVVYHARVYIDPSFVDGHSAMLTR